MPTKHFAFSFGLKPKTNLGYRVNVKSLLDDLDTTTLYQGFGGVNTTFLGFAVSPIKGLSLGIMANYNFGFTEKVFTQNISSTVKSKFLAKNDSLDSIAELFTAANWLEREIAELHGVSFFGKKDLRNLMLQYGDSTAPFQKAFPSIGIKEIFYNPVKDTLVQNHLSLQL